MFFILFFFAFGCSGEPTPEAVYFGKEPCHHCAMKIHDHRYGGLILTEKGKSYKFDSLECLLNFEAKNLPKNEKIFSRYVFNTFKQGDLIKLEKANFLLIPNTRSPMGLGIWASDSQDEMMKAQKQFGGEVLQWSQLKSRIEQK